MNNKRHPHADVIIAWAEGKEIQVANQDKENWRDVSENELYFRTDFRYRIKPETILVNGIEVPKPETEAPEEGEDYYTPQPCNFDFFTRATWWGTEYDVMRLNRGLVHLLKENAIKHGEAMVEIKE